MGLFDFKKEARKIFSADNIQEVLDMARSLIIEQAKKEIPGYEKKVAVDYRLTEFIKSKVSGCNNKMILWLTDRIIDAVPRITQLVYDLLKTKVENL